MLKIKDIEVSVDDKIILNGFNLDINDGEIVAVMDTNYDTASKSSGSFATPTNIKPSFYI